LLRLPRVSANLIPSGDLGSIGPMSFGGLNLGISPGSSLGLVGTGGSGVSTTSPPSD